MACTGVFKKRLKDCRIKENVYICTPNCLHLDPSVNSGKLTGVKSNISSFE